MKYDTLKTQVNVWKRIEFTELSPTAARALLKFGFSADDHERMKILSAKARAGTLSDSEEAEIATYEQLGCLLDILHTKARLALKKHKQAS